MDIVKLDVPLFIRLLELAREDIKQDADIHDLAQRVIELSRDNTATMADYDNIVAFMKAQGKNSTEEESMGNDDIRRFRQIVDLADKQQTEYTNTPKEEYAAMDAVTSKAGGGWQTPKDPADIKGEHPSLYPGKVYGVR
jgi:Zn-dependent M32 family carboxypeptidase